MEYGYGPGVYLPPRPRGQSYDNIHKNGKSSSTAYFNEDKSGEGGGGGPPPPELVLSESLSSDSHSSSQSSNHASSHVSNHVSSSSNSNMENNRIPSFPHHNMYNNNPIIHNRRSMSTCSTSGTIETESVHSDSTRASSQRSSLRGAAGSIYSKHSTSPTSSSSSSIRRIHVGIDEMQRASRSRSRSRSISATSRNVQEYSIKNVNSKPITTTRRNSSRSRSRSTSRTPQKKILGETSSSSSSRSRSTSRSRSSLSSSKSNRSRSLSLQRKSVGGGAGAGAGAGATTNTKAGGTRGKSFNPAIHISDVTCPSNTTSSTSSISSQSLSSQPSVKTRAKLFEANSIVNNSNHSSGIVMIQPPPPTSMQSSQSSQSSQSFRPSRSRSSSRPKVVGTKSTNSSEITPLQGNTTTTTVHQSQSVSQSRQTSSKPSSKAFRDSIGTMSSSSTFSSDDDDNDGGGGQNGYHVRSKQSRSLSKSRPTKSIQISAPPAPESLLVTSKSIQSPPSKSIPPPSPSKSFPAAVRLTPERLDTHEQEYLYGKNHTKVIQTHEFQSLLSNQERQIKEERYGGHEGKTRSRSTSISRNSRLDNEYGGGGNGSRVVAVPTRSRSVSRSRPTSTNGSTRTKSGTRSRSASRSRVVVASTNGPVLVTSSSSSKSHSRSQSRSRSKSRSIETAPTTSTSTSSSRSRSRSRARSSSKPRSSSRIRDTAVNTHEVGHSKHRSRSTSRSRSRSHSQIPREKTTHRSHSRHHHRSRSSSRAKEYMQNNDYNNNQEENPSLQLQPQSQPQPQPYSQNSDRVSRQHRTSSRTRASSMRPPPLNPELQEIRQKIRGTRSRSLSRPRNGASSGRSSSSNSGDGNGFNNFQEPLALKQHYMVSPSHRRQQQQQQQQQQDQEQEIYSGRQQQRRNSGSIQQQHRSRSLSRPRESIQESVNLSQTLEVEPNVHHDAIQTAVTIEGPVIAEMKENEMFALKAGISYSREGGDFLTMNSPNDHQHDIQDRSHLGNLQLSPRNHDRHNNPRNNRYQDEEDLPPNATFLRHDGADNNTLNRHIISNDDDLAQLKTVAGHLCGDWVSGNSGKGFIAPALARRFRDFQFAQMKRRKKFGDERPWGIMGLYDYLSAVRMDVEWAEEAACKRGNGEPYKAWFQFLEESNRGSNRPFFTFIVMAVCTGFMIASIAINGWSIEPFSTNPMIGPSAETLVLMGAKDSALIVQYHEVWRLISPMVLHAGFIHYFLNMLALWFVGSAVEKSHGFLPCMLLFILPAIGGTVLSAIFLPQYVSVGASGGIFGLIGACLADIFMNWGILFNKVVNGNQAHRHAIILFVLVADIALNSIIGLTPFVDNFTHLGGMAFGFLCGTSTMERVSTDIFGGEQKRTCWAITKRTILRYFGIIISVAGLAVSLSLLMEGDGANTPCKSCGALSCVAFPPWADYDNKWWYCDDCGSATATATPVDDMSEAFVDVTLNCPSGESVPVQFFEDSMAAERSWVEENLPNLCRKYC